MKEEVFTLLKSKIKGSIEKYRLLTIRDRKKPIYISVRKDGQTYKYKVIAGTEFELTSNIEARATLSDNKEFKITRKSMELIDSIRTEVEMSKDGVAIFDSSETQDIVSLARAITDNYKITLHDIVDYCDEYIGVSKVIAYNNEFEEDIHNWYWSEDYFKMLLEGSPYNKCREYNEEFIKAQASTKDSDLFMLINRNLEMVVLSGSKVSMDKDKYVSAKVSLNGLSSDLRNCVDDGVLKYNSFVCDKTNSALRALMLKASAFQSVKFVRNSDLYLKDVKAAYDDIIQNNDDESIRQAKIVLTKFETLINDAKQGMKYKVCRSLAFIRRYSHDFYVAQYTDTKNGICVELLISNELNYGYILKGSKINTTNIVVDRLKNLRLSNQIIRERIVNGVMQEDSPGLNYKEISSILYNCDGKNHEDMFNKLKYDKANAHKIAMLDRGVKQEYSEKSSEDKKKIVKLESEVYVLTEKVKSLLEQNISLSNTLNEMEAKEEQKSVRISVLEKDLKAKEGMLKSIVELVSKQ